MHLFDMRKLMLKVSIIVSLFLKPVNAIRRFINQNTGNCVQQRYGNIHKKWSEIEFSVFWKLVGHANLSLFYNIYHFYEFNKEDIF